MLKCNVNVLSSIKKIIMVIIGNGLVALGVCCFIIPMNFIMGGVTGLSLIANHFFGINLSTITYIVNGFFFILAIIFMGRKFAFGIIVSTVVYPSFLYIFERIPDFYYHGDDVMLAMIFAAAIIGFGDGLILKNGASSGGLEVFSCIMNKKFGLSLPLMINAVDMCILMVQLFYSSVEQILYGILLTCVLTIVLDKVLVIGQKRDQVTVISEKHAEIREYLLTKLDLGCTVFDAHTGYKNIETNAIVCVLPPRKITELYAAVLDIDKNAFIITAEVTNVKGRGFSLPKLWAE